jgi:hypothetical protein
LDAVSSCLIPRTSTGGLHDRDFCSDAVEPHDAIHAPALDLPVALQLESELINRLTHAALG